MAGNQAAARDEAGFTLVELLVVMLIIGLLAAIALPSFFGQSDKARDAAAKASARTAAGAIEVYATDHDGSYSGATPAGLQAVEPTIDAATLDVTGWDGTGAPSQSAYRVTVASPTGNHFWYSRDAASQATLGCDVPGHAGCPLNGRWG